MIAMGLHPNLLINQSICLLFSSSYLQDFLSVLQVPPQVQNMTDWLFCKSKFAVEIGVNIYDIIVLAPKPEILLSFWSLN